MAPSRPQPSGVDARHPSARDNHFNFLRLVFAALVLVGHSPELVDGDQHRELFAVVFRNGMTFGGVAVEGFFLLSGYLIVQSWLRQPHWGDYLRKRALRIYPGFVAASLVCALVVGPLAAPAAAYLADFRPLGFLGGVCLLRQPIVPPVFAGLPYPLVNGAMWTIPLEFCCYLLVPILASAGLLRWRTGWLLLTAVLLLTAAAMTFFGLERFEHTWFSEVPVGAFSRLLSCFCVGSACYLFRDRLRPRPWWLILAALLLGAGLFRHKVFSHLALCTAGAYLLFSFAFAPLPRLDVFKALPDISYGLYLYGWPTQNLLLWYFAGISPWALLAAALPVSLLLGWVSWEAVERPFLRLKPRQKTLQASPPAGGYQSV